MDKRSLYFIFALGLVMLLPSCGKGPHVRRLQQISRISESDPDSALTLLAHSREAKDHWGKYGRMYYNLVLLKAQNKADTVFRSDSLATVTVDYFRYHGSASERVLAYYLLGRSHDDMGDAPRALRDYYDAIEQADTTSEDCYNTLMGVYGQMAMIFHRQDLPQDEIWALRHYLACVKRQGNQVDYEIEKGQLTRPYYLLGKEDTVLQIIHDVKRNLDKLGAGRAAANLLPSAIFILPSAAIWLRQSN